MGGVYERFSRTERRLRRFDVVCLVWSAIWLPWSIVNALWLSALIHLAFVLWQVRLLRSSYRREHAALQLDWLEAELFR